MAYKRSYKRGRYSKGTRKYIKGTGSKRMSYKKPSNKRTGGYVGIEVKCLDQGAQANLPVPTVTIAGAFVSATIGNIQCNPPTMKCLNAPGVGPAFYQRDGRQIYMRSIYVNGLLKSTNMDTATSTNYQSPFVVVALVLDTQCNAAENNLGDVFVCPMAGQGQDEATNIIYGVANPLPNLEKRTRYRILKLKRIPIPTESLVNNTAAGDTYLTIAQNKAFSISHKFRGKGLPVTFTGANAGSYATVVNIADNALHLVGWLCGLTSGIHAMGAISLSYNSRLRYVG